MDYEIITENTIMVKRAEPGSDNQCQGTTATGQCPLEAVPNTPYCAMHNGNAVAKSQERQSLNLYRVTKYKERIREHADHPKIRTLAEEIALVRILIEERLATIANSDDPNMMLLHSGPLVAMIDRVRTLLETSVKLDEKLGVLLSQEQADAFTDTIMQILSEEIKDPDVLTRIAHRLVEAYPR